MFAFLRALILFLLLVVIPLLAIFALAPHSPTAGRIAFELTIPVRRALTTAEYLQNRHPNCSVSELWRMAKPAVVRDAYRHQILQTDGPIHLVRTAAGDFWSPIRDLPTLLEMADEQAEEIYTSTRALVRKDDVVLDVGSNAGMFTRKALARGAALVVAIEPNPELVHCLRRTFAAEIQQRRVIVYPKGLWDRETELMLTTSQDHASMANSVAMPRGDRGPVVPLTTMDSMVAELRLPRVDFIKMDIEGAEPQALAGGRQTIRKYRPRLAIAMEHRASDWTEIPALLNSISPGANTEQSPYCTPVEKRVVPQVLFVF